MWYSIAEFICGVVFLYYSYANTVNSILMLRTCSIPSENTRKVYGWQVLLWAISFVALIKVF